MAIMIIVMMAQFTLDSAGGPKTQVLCKHVLNPYDVPGSPL